MNRQWSVHGSPAAQKDVREKRFPAGKPTYRSASDIIAPVWWAMSNRDRMGQGGRSPAPSSQSSAGIDCASLSPSLRFEAFQPAKNCARNQCWRGFRRIVTTGRRPVVTMRVGADGWRRNTGKCWRRDRGGRVCIAVGISIAPYPPAQTRRARCTTL